MLRRLARRRAIAGSSARSPTAARAASLGGRRDGEPSSGPRSTWIGPRSSTRGCRTPRSGSPRPRSGWCWRCRPRTGRLCKALPAEGSRRPTSAASRRPAGCESSLRRTWSATCDGVPPRWPSAGHAESVCTPGSRAGAVELPTRNDFDATCCAMLGPWDVAARSGSSASTTTRCRGGRSSNRWSAPTTIGPADAAVVRPVRALDSRGSPSAAGSIPATASIDPYAMALPRHRRGDPQRRRRRSRPGADRAPRQLLLGQPESPGSPGGLVLAAQGCHDAAIAYGVPFISGKDSPFQRVPADGRELAADSRYVAHLRHRHRARQRDACRRCISNDPEI